MISSLLKMRQLMLTLAIVIIALSVSACGNPSAVIEKQPDCLHLRDFVPADYIVERTYLIQYIATTPEGEPMATGTPLEDYTELKRLTDVEDVRAIISQKAEIGNEDVWIETWTAHLAAAETLIEGCHPERGRSQILIPNNFADDHNIQLGDKLVALDEKEFTVSGIYDSTPSDDTGDVLYISDELGSPAEFDELLVIFNQKAAITDAENALYNYFSHREIPVLITNAKSGESFSNEQALE